MANKAEVGRVAEPFSLESPEGRAWYARAEKIMDQVPFLNDWVEYKGEIYFAELDIIKSVACGRPVIGLGYCATAVIVNRRLDVFRNYSPETCKPCRFSRFPETYI